MGAPRKEPTSLTERAELGRRLRQHREAAGYTLAQAGATVGCSIGHLANIEAGRRRLTAGRLIALAALYAVPVDVITSSERVA